MEKGEVDELEVEECVVGYGEGVGLGEGEACDGSEVVGEVYETVGLMQLQYGPEKRTLGEVREVCLDCVRKILGVSDAVSG
jgi:hypothetical protein